MSREIKFRAWDKENKSMEKVDFLGEKVIKISNAEWENIEHFDIMPYTGFKDCENQEIYENHILHGTVEYDNGLLCITEDDYVVVKFDDDEGCWVVQDKEGNNLDLLSAYLDYKVIGNIYENPELLEAIK